MMQREEVDMRTDLRTAMEYESRLFDGGAYSAGRYIRERPGSPAAKMIKAGRQRYNELRMAYGMQPIVDWGVAPNCRLADRIRSML
jgi:hypothetical protein